MRKVSLFRNGRNQAIRIPVEYELPGEEATIERDGDALVIRPSTSPPKSFAELFDDWEVLPEFPDVDDGELPPDIARTPLE